MTRIITITATLLILSALVGGMIALAQTAKEPPTELYVRTVPAGAVVLVDGKQVGKSDNLFEVKPGVRKIEVKLDGYEPGSKKVTVPAARIKRVLFKLKKALPGAGKQRATDGYAVKPYGYTHVTIFEPVGKFRPKTPIEMLNVLNRTLRRSGINTGYFRTKVKGDILVGLICSANPDGLRKVLDRIPELKWKKTIRLTRPMFKAHEAREQESMPGPAPRPVKTYPKIGATDAIIEGVGWKDVRVGMKREDLIKAMGKPDNDPSSNVLRWADKHIDCSFHTGSLVVSEVRFNKGFNGALKNSIKLGSLGDAMLKLYGEPDRVTDRRNGAKKYEYSTKGILFWTYRGRITQIVVFKPYSSSRRNSKPTGNPRPVKTYPKIGATDVSPGLKKIRVTFDRDMKVGSHSWCGGGPHYPKVTGEPKWIDRRTCVLPVELEEGKAYRLALNWGRFNNFRAADGTPATPTALYFCTRGASPEQVAQMTPPTVVKLSIENGAKNVPPGRTKLSVTFDQTMGGGMSWYTPALEHEPVKGSAWSADKKTCSIYALLKPGRSYTITLNNANFGGNFMNELGVSLKPTTWKFTTSTAGDRGD